VSDTDADTVERMEHARKAILAALDGLPKERCCVILATIAADFGLYDQAIDLLKLAKKQRDNLFKAGDVA